VAGLGSAPRELLATSLALFDDGSLQARLRSLWDKWKPGQPTGPDGAVETARSVQGTVERWLHSPLADDDLRLLLWMRLRESFELPELCFASARSAGSAADDLVARALQSLQPGRVGQWLEARGWREGKSRSQTLDVLARATLQEILESILKAEDTQTGEVRELLLKEVRGKLNGLDTAARKKLLEAVGADELNDTALRRIVLTGGGLGAFGAGVSMAGFSAYILAAQLSAFIPLVSGPALVSLVSVISNPITIVVSTVGVAWWASTSANADIRMAISARVISLLALSGTMAGEAGVRGMIGAFPRIPDLRTPEAFDAKVIARYAADWQVVAHARQGNREPAGVVLERMEHAPEISRLETVLPGRVDEARNAATLGVMTLGEILYNAYRIDPLVLEAADFSRAQDLGDPVAFAAFAEKVSNLGEAGVMGAVSNLKGYVAERVVAAQLVAQGYVVEFPDYSNEAGWDIAVDGVRYQVKNVQSLSALERHFDRGYEYPVIANAEMAGEIAAHGDAASDWMSQVHFVEGYNNEIVEHVTRDSLDAGTDMLHPHVPAFSVLLSGLRNYRRASRGEISGSQAVQEVLLDGGTRAGLAVVGGYVGSGVGLLIFGPAGGLVFGSVTPVVTQMQAGLFKKHLDGFFTSRAYKEWEPRAQHAIQGLVGVLESGIQAKLALFEHICPREGMGGVGDYLRWRWDEDINALREASCRLGAICKSGARVEAQARMLMQWLGGRVIFPAEYQGELEAVALAFKARPTLAERVTERTKDALEASAVVAVEALDTTKKVVGQSIRALGDWWNSPKKR